MTVLGSALESSQCSMKNLGFGLVGLMFHNIECLDNVLFFKYQRIILECRFTNNKVLMRVNVLVRNVSDELLITV